MQGNSWKEPRAILMSYRMWIKMMYPNRVWVVRYISTIRDLAQKLTEYTWCRCTGFQIGHYVFLNDSTGADGAQEYGVIKTYESYYNRDGLHDCRVHQGQQIESITFGWMDAVEAEDLLVRMLRGDYDTPDMWCPTQFLIDHAEHHRCDLCR